MKLTHKYAPAVLGVFSEGRYRDCAVAGYVAHPPGTHPNSGIRPEFWAVEFRFHGAPSRFRGCEYAYINAQLRMVLVFRDLRDEVVRKQWRTVPGKFRAPIPESVKGQ